MFLPETIKVVHVLAGPDLDRLEHSPNTLTYPESKYDNLRNGFGNE